MSTIKATNRLSALFALTFGFLLTACDKPAADTPQASYLHVANLSEIRQQTSYSVTREYIGKISAKQQTNLSFEYGGRVTQVLKDSGETFNTGDVIARLDVELLTIRVAELEAQIAQIDAEITLNQANLVRIQELIKKHYASEQNIDELESQAQVLNANKKGIQANLAALNYQIAKAELRAPYSGIINERLISQGDLVTAGKPAFTLIKQSQQEITLGVPATIAATLNVGDNLPATINQHAFSATVTAVGQQINPATRTVTIRLTIDNMPENISGLLTRVAIEQQVEHSGYWVPLTAITDGVRGQWNIYGVTPHTDHFKVVAHTVDVLHSTATKAYITGLTADSINIISEGLHRYVPGQIIRAAGEQL